MVAKYLGGKGYFATFNSDNTWFNSNLSSKLRAGGLPGDPRCTEEEEGETVVAYVKGEVNSVWYKPKSPTAAVCSDDPPRTYPGGTGAAGGSHDINALTNEEAELFAKMEADYKKRMREEEKTIFEKISPYERLKYLMNAKDAEVKAAQHVPNSLENGKGDAFRYAFFSTLNRTMFDVDQAKLLGVLMRMFRRIH